MSIVEINIHCFRNCPEIIMNNHFFIVFDDKSIDEKKPHSNEKSPVILIYNSIH